MPRLAPLLRATGRAPSWWLPALALLVAVRLAVPLVVLADHGHKAPGLPRWSYVAQSGDAQGFYAAAREFIAAWTRLPHLVLALLAAAAVGAAWWLAREWRRRPGRRPWLLAAGALAVGLLACAGISKMGAPGAAVIGWSLLWAIPMLPLRAAHALNPDSAFAVGLVLSLLANAVGIVATAVAGFRASGSRAVGVLAGACVAAWPLLVEPIAGRTAWENGQWLVDTGLHLYTEPLSTALCACALALLLAERSTSLQLSLAGVLLGYATVVKLSNGLVLAGAIVLVHWRLGRGRTLPLLAGGLALMPVVAVYWHLGYVPVFDNPQSWPTRPFSVLNVVPGWRDNLIFHPLTLAVLAPLAALGAWALRRRGSALALLALWVVANAVFYSFYRNLPQHPRFLYAALPALWVLEATGAAWLVARGAALLRGRPSGSGAAPAGPAGQVGR